MCSYTNSE